MSGSPSPWNINVAAAILGVFDHDFEPAPWAIGAGTKAVEVSTAHRPVRTP